MNRNNRYSVICALLFGAFLFVIMISYALTLISKPITATSAEELQSFLDSQLPYHESWINLYGLTQRILGKRQIQEFTIFKTDYNKLVAPRSRIEEDRINASSKGLFNLIDMINKTGTPYYYINSLLPIQSIDDLPIGVQEGSHINQEILRRILSDSNIRVIDLSQSEEIKRISKEALFYRTDHHWSIEACFASYKEIIQKVEADCEFDLNSKMTTDICNYSELKIPNSFLGSYGVKVGPYYAGKDDFIVYIPLFETKMRFENYDTDDVLLMEKSGDFYHALLDDELLNDMNYLNKYNAFCNYGYIKNRIINLDAPNSKKCLYISHSYGRPLTMYLALNFSEVVNIDPQEGRFSGNYSTFIEEYSPDLILIQSEFEGEIIGVYNTSD